MYEDKIWQQSFLCGQASRVKQFTSGSSSDGQFTHLYFAKLRQQKKLKPKTKQQKANLHSFRLKSHSYVVSY